jgi:hypothetical protein
MNPRADNVFGIHQQRGFWLRCFLAASLLGSTLAISPAQCVSRTISVSRVRGAVFDPYGQPVPNVELSLKQEENIVARSTTNDKGQFAISASPGIYWLWAKAAGFVPGYARLEVGNDLIGALKPTHLWMILYVGRSGTDECDSVTTTSHRQFEKTISSNHEPRTTDHE